MRTTATLSIGRSYLAATSSGPLVFFGGGVVFSTKSDVVDIFNTNFLIWTTATLSQARCYLAATSSGSLVFFGGGENAAGSRTNVVDIFNTSSSIWTIATLSVGRIRLAATSLGSLVFFGGGLSDVGVSNIVDIFHTTSGIWSIETLSLARFHLAAASTNSLVFFAGCETAGIGLSNVIDIFDTISWTTATLSEAKSSVSVVSCDPFVLFAGGITSVYLDSVDILNTNTFTWTTATLSQSSMPHHWELKRTLPVVIRLSLMFLILLAGLLTPFLQRRDSPSTSPSSSPNTSPTLSPSISPSSSPSLTPSASPNFSPSKSPSTSPSSSPSTPLCANEFFFYRKRQVLAGSCHSCYREWTPVSLGDSFCSNCINGVSVFTRVIEPAVECFNLKNDSSNYFKVVPCSYPCLNVSSLSDLNDVLPLLQNSFENSSYLGDFFKDSYNISTSITISVVNNEMIFFFVPCNSSSNFSIYKGILDSLIRDITQPNSYFDYLVDQENCSIKMIAKKNNNSNPNQSYFGLFSLFFIFAIILVCLTWLFLKKNISDGLHKDIRWSFAQRESILEFYILRKWNTNTRGNSRYFSKILTGDDYKKVESLWSCYMKASRLSTLKKSLQFITKLC